VDVVDDVADGAGLELAAGSSDPLQAATSKAVAMAVTRAAATRLRWRITGGGLSGSADGWWPGGDGGQGL
jgi:hypothetical protein